MKKNDFVIKNKKAYHDYFILDKYEAGISLRGGEVKSIREGKSNLTDAYVRIKDEEIFLINSYIAPYEFCNEESEPTRARKLLLHRHEIIKLQVQVNQKGLTIIPLKLYFTRGKVKLQIAVSKGKQNYDKRHDLKKKIQNREMHRAIKDS